MRHPIYGNIEYVLPVSVKAIVNYNGRVPLLLNERDEWELPGGRLDPGESPEEAAEREVREELQLDVEIGSLVDAWVYRVLEIRHVFVVVYDASLLAMTEPRLSHEHRRLGLFSRDEISTLRMPSRYGDAIYRAMNDRWG